MSKPKVKTRFVNRELSWLSFNARVLQEASDPGVPLVERIRFLGIFSNNQDEFFRVRVATIRRIAGLGKSIKPLLGGMKPKKLLSEIQQVVVEQHRRFNEIFEGLMKELRREGIHLINEDQILKRHDDFVRQYFYEKVRPALVPIMLNEIDQMPMLRDKSLYLAIRFARKGSLRSPTYALVELPTDKMSRFVVLPEWRGRKYIMLLDDLIRYRLDEIFHIFDYDKIEAFNIKVTRDAELDIENDFSSGYVEQLKRSLKMRSRGEPVRFIYDREIPNDLLRFLTEKLELGEQEHLIPGARYHNFKDFMDFPNLGSKQLEYNRTKALLHPSLAGRKSVFEAITEGDVMLHYPYQSFSHLIDLLREAAIDPAVSTIKMTLYRVAGQSAVVNSLINAAKNGKKVSVVVELQARFDEEANIYWANQMHENGVTVIYGVPGYKVHSKLLYIIRKEDGGLREYAQIGTGNFNEKTARIYCDDALFTANEQLTFEVGKVFNYFENNLYLYNYKHLVVSPHGTRTRFIELINEEIEQARKGRKAEVFLKMNSLVDPELIEKLYEAGQAGVRVRLIVRGICSLIPGEKGLSENIEAISIVDKYLEHSRVYCFYHKGDWQVYIGSADLMPRNLNNRVEVSTPIYNEALRQELIDMLEIQWKDNTKSRRLTDPASNEYRKSGKREVRAQSAIYEYLKRRYAKN